MAKGSSERRRPQLDEATLFRSAEKLLGLIPDVDRGAGNEFGLRVVPGRLCTSECRNEITTGDFSSS